MALSYVQYSGDGATTLFTVPFPYVLAEHVSVYLDGAPTSFAWSSETVVSVTPAPAIGEIVRIERVTPTDAPMVDYVDGTVLTEAALDLNTTQMLYIVQEAQDQADTSITQNTAGNWDGQDKVAEDFADPVFSDDLATKNYVDTAGDSKVAQAAQSAANAATSETNAAASAVAANSSATDATASETAAAASETAAGVSASAASGSADAAAVSAASASSSSASAVTAKTDAEAAEVGANDAETAAVNAKNAAQTAQSNAETAEAAAELAQNLAEVAQANAEAQVPLAAANAASALDQHGFKNFIINGDFRVTERNASLVNLNSTGIASSYITDRWRGVIWNGDADFDAQGFFTPQREYHNYMNINVRSNAVVVALKTNVENYRCLLGRTVTFSFLGKGVGVDIPMIMRLIQTVGASSPGTDKYWDQNITMAASAWARYSYTVTLQDKSTLNPYNDSTGLACELIMPAGTTGNIHASSFQLELGTEATEFEQRDRSVEQMMCHRYFYRTRALAELYDDGANGAASGKKSVVAPIQFPTQMRTTPTAVIESTHGSNNGTPKIGSVQNESAHLYVESDGSSSGQRRRADCTLTFDADY